jgi:hypothetical protein
MDANNLVLLLNILERRGHAVRERDPNDRRRHVVNITEQDAPPSQPRRTRWSGLTRTFSDVSAGRSARTAAAPGQGAG